MTWLLGAVLAMPTGQGASLLVTTGSFVWPTDNFGASLGGLLVGEPGRGLPAEVSADIPSTTLVYVCVLITEAVLAAAALWCLGMWWRTVGPSAQFGMARRHEVASVLGRRSLLNSRRTIRPDLERRA